MDFNKSINEYKMDSFEEESLEINSKLLLCDLETFDFVSMSLSPNYPGSEEGIKHEVIKAEIIKARTGLLLILELLNINSEEKYTYAYNDIVNIEESSLRNIDFTKYYLECTNRERARHIKQINTRKKDGYYKSNAFDEKTCELGTTDTFRILFSNKR